MRLTGFGKVLIAAVVATAVVAAFAPTVALVMTIVLAVVGLAALAEGFMSSGAEAGHEAWARVEAERKAEALKRGR
jgi:hypothetical protein